MSSPEPRPPLMRPRSERMLMGVCAGLAQHLGLPLFWVRVGMVLFAGIGGAGVVVYVFLALTVPEEGESQGVAPLRSALTAPGEASQAAEGDPRSAGLGRWFGGSGPEYQREPKPRVREQRERRAPRETPQAEQGSRWPIAELLLGGVLLLAGIALVLVQLGVQLRLNTILPALAVLGGVGLTWWLIADRDRPEKHQLPRVLAALALVAVGVLMFFITAREPSVLTVIGAALAVLAGVGLAVAPWLLRQNRQLGAERAARAREAERADIAAHLHDSVLQTLALIQQQSTPGSDVARLARGQERELREWLFRAADGAPVPDRETAEAELSAHAASLEANHQVRFDVVVVGERVVGPEALIAAAREAMLNAARHAGGEVTVYLETTPELMRVEINDRGPGFDLERIGEQRLGVRESIIGRMERAGASARIVPGPGGRGTSVRLEQARAGQAPAPENSNDQAAAQAAPEPPKAAETP